MYCEEIIMKNFEWLITWLTPHVSALYHFLGGITVSLVLGIPIVFLFGDTLLSLIGHALTVLGHGLHFVFEIFESITGHILEKAFHLHKRTAEIIFFWSSLAVAIGLSWHLMRKAHKAALRVATTVQEQRQALAEASKITAWIRISLIISSLSATLYFFT
jgi:hypothetical protein